MEVHMDSPNKLEKYKKYISTKLLITQPSFELQTPDFPRKILSVGALDHLGLVWPTDSTFWYWSLYGMSQQMTKKYISNKQITKLPNYLIIT